MLTLEECKMCFEGLDLEKLKQGIRHLMIKKAVQSVLAFSSTFQIKMAPFGRRERERERENSEKERYMRRRSATEQNGREKLYYVQII